MTAIDTPALGGLIPMTGEADAIGFGGLELGGLLDIGGGQRFDVLTARTVAAFAGIVFKAAFLIGFHHVVRVVLEGVEDVLVTHLAGSGADEFRRLVLGGRRSGSAGIFLGAPHDG